MSRTFPTVFKCESGTDCQHIVPDDIYARLNDWCKTRSVLFDGLFICHQDCVDNFVVLKHEGVWCVARESPE